MNRILNVNAANVFITDLNSGKGKKKRHLQNTDVFLFMSEGHLLGDYQSCYQTISIGFRLSNTHKRLQGSCCHSFQGLGTVLTVQSYSTRVCVYCNLKFITVNSKADCLPLTLQLFCRVHCLPLIVHYCTSTA